MKVKFCDLQKNYLNIKDEVDKNISTVLNNCNYILGNEVELFEKNFANYIGMKHCIGVANGTDALEIAISSLNLPDNSEIIVQGNTYIATTFAVLNNKYKLVLCDINNDYMINLDDLKNKITINTKAIIVVHLYGSMPNMDKLMNIINKYNLYLIEDCAQAHGAMYNNKKAGSFGIISCFSFYPSKNLGAYGDGGAILTNDDNINNKIRLINNMGSRIKYNHQIIGRNSRLDTIQATILNTKLKYLDKNNKNRNEIANLYYELLKDIKCIELPNNNYNNIYSVYHLYVIKCINRNELQKYLTENNIETLIHYPIPISLTEAMNNYYFDTPNCVKLSNNILSLPMYPELTIDEVTFVCTKIKDFYNKKNNLITFNVPDKYGSLHSINNFFFEPVKRLFYIDGFNTTNLPVERGFHSNINFNEFIIIIEGQIELILCDKHNNKTTIILNKNDTYFIPLNMWIIYRVLLQNTIILVLADKSFDESISERDFNKFIN
jgi:dTDP-4-amino-4,6-dideoxygalactose transaminase